MGTQGPTHSAASDPPRPPNIAAARSQSRIWSRRLAVVVTGCAAILLLMAAGGAAALLHLDRSLERVSVEGLTDPSSAAPRATEPSPERDPDPQLDAAAEPAEPDGIDEVTTVLIMGSDDRSVLSPAERETLAVGDNEGERTEAIMLARIDPAGPEIQGLRFPRDLLVERCDGSHGRINAAYGIGEANGIGGASCLVQTLTAWTGLEINHAVKVDFASFVELVDAAGGVTVEIAEPLQDDHAGLDIPAGSVRLDGPDALAFVRARRLDDDFGRIERQNQLMAALLDEVSGTSPLSEPLRTYSLLDTAAASLEVDQQLTRKRMRELAATAADIGPDDLVLRTVPGTDDVESEEAFLVPDTEAAEALFEAFARGELDSQPVYVEERANRS